MPLYEYRCDAGHRFEVIRKFSDPPLETCPTCGSPVQKLASSPAIQFKGTGWYITDYAKKDHAPAGKSEGSHAETTEKDRGEKGDKGEKRDAGEKTDKSEKADKSDKGTSAAASTPSSGATTPSTGASTKDP